MDEVEPAFCTMTVGTAVGAFVTTCCCVLLSELVLLWCARLNNTMNDPTSSAVNNTAAMVLKGRCHDLTLCIPLFIIARPFSPRSLSLYSTCGFILSIV